MKRAIAVLVIWALFVLAQPLGFALGLLSLVHPKTRRYGERVLKAQNRATAAILGVGDGAHGVSHECGLLGARATFR